jgi:uncharacterized membrane protein
MAAKKKARSKRTARKSPARSVSRAQATTRSGVSDEAKAWGFLGALLPIIGYLVILLAKKGGAYAEFYGKQGLVLGIAAIIVSVAGWILAIIPVIGQAVHWVLQAAILVLWIIGMINALSGTSKDLPLIGEYAGRF